MLKNFVESRLEKWRRLEDLTNRASKLRLRSLKGDEVREFGRLYRRTAADLAIAREEVRDKRLINYLNYLVSRAHGAIYRSESSGFEGILQFYRYEFPAVFRQTFRYTVISFLIFFAAALFAFTVVQLDESFADRISPQLHRDIAAHHNWTDAIRQYTPLAATSIQANNISVTFLAFAGGVVAGLLTIWMLAQNGMLLGAVMSLCITHRFWAIPIFVAAHGVIELTAIFIAGGGGLLVGRALLMPGELKRSDALVTNGLLAIKLIVGCIPMLIIAGFIEGFISPAKIPTWYKLAVATISGLLMLLYFLKPDRRRGA